MPMITEYLDQKYVIRSVTNLHQLLTEWKKGVAPENKALRRKLEKLPSKQLDLAIARLAESLEKSRRPEEDNPDAPYIPRDPFVCAIQAAWTRHAKTELAAKAAGTASRGARDGKGRQDTSPSLQLRKSTRPTAAQTRRISLGGFVENDDLLYGYDGLTGQIGMLLSGGRRKFNQHPAKTASSERPLRLFLFGDWGTGLPLAKEVALRIQELIDAGDESRMSHVVHLGDVYYAGEVEEYQERMLDLWPVRRPETKSIGSWSLNGNHDMYSGGYCFFDTLLRDRRFLAWHGDEDGEPSSFFLIEDPHWQIYGLDTAWAAALPSLTNFGGQNGVLTREQVTWMKKTRNPAKGCVLLTHHQCASSRKSESQHSEEAVKALVDAGLYSQLDAWIWGHEHRAVVFKPRAKRKDARLKAAPNFCACVGHAGVPVNAKNFAAGERKPDVDWDESRIGGDSPTYLGKSIAPFGFALLDTFPDRIDFSIIDHQGRPQYSAPIRRGTV